MAEKTPKQVEKYLYATGRRKTAVAQVRIIPGGTGKITLNDKIVTGEPTYVAPLKAVGKFGSVDLSLVVKGGGFQGQIDAIQHGISRALVVLDEEYKTTLRKAGYLTRDPRAKERKKPGLKSARRAPQWSKR
jgi:small subunit ribosomal protein S9